MIISVGGLMSKTKRVARDSVLRVLQSTNGPDGTTRFVDQVVYSPVKGEKPPSERAHFLFFSWKVALFGQYDVFHVHWPELLIRSSRRRSRLIGKTAFAILLLRLTIRRIPVVRTVHNLRPHEVGGLVERTLLALLDRVTTLFVRINPVTDLGTRRSVTILHGHYIDRFGAFAKSTPRPGRLIYFGLIRPYKGVEALVEAFQHVSDDLSLRIVGRPTDDLRTMVENACQASANITARLEFVADEDLVSELTQSELVVLPYKEMHNSGAVLVALSLDRPVLVPSTPTTRALQDEVGREWVHVFEGALDPDVLSQTLAAVHGSEFERKPRLSGRDWGRVAEAYQQTYRDAVRLKRPLNP